MGAMNHAESTSARTSPWGCVLALAAFLLPSAAGAEVGLTLMGQHGELDLTQKTPTLRFSVLIKSGLSVPVEGVRIGVLFANTAGPLEKAEAAALYRKGTSPQGEVGVIDSHVKVKVQPEGEAPVVLEIPLKPGDPEPRAFVTHVLGYDLGAVKGALLLQLLSTEAASDEFAAVSALGLLGDHAARQSARRRHGPDAELHGILRAEATHPVPARPSETETFRRVYAIRGLGVLGGAQARQALEEVQKLQGLERFDEPLQVLRIARLVGSPIETPLAYSIPRDIQGMRQLVELALKDVGALAAADESTAEPTTAVAQVDAPPPAEAAAVQPLPALEAGGEITQEESTSPMLAAVLTGTLAGALVAVGLLAVQRRRDKGRSA